MKPEEKCCDQIPNGQYTEAVESINFDPSTLPSPPNYVLVDGKKVDAAVWFFDIACKEREAETAFCYKCGNPCLPSYEPPTYCEFCGSCRYCGRPGVYYCGYPGDPDCSVSVCDRCGVAFYQSDSSQLLCPTCLDPALRKPICPGYGTEWTCGNRPADNSTDGFCKNCLAYLENERLEQASADAAAIEAEEKWRYSDDCNSDIDDNFCEDDFYSDDMLDLYNGEGSLDDHLYADSPHPHKPTPQEIAEEEAYYDYLLSLDYCDKCGESKKGNCHSDGCVCPDYNASVYPRGPEPECGCHISPNPECPACTPFDQRREPRRYDNT